MEKAESLNFVYNRFKHLDKLIMELDKMHTDDIGLQTRMLCECWKAIKEFV